MKNIKIIALILSVFLVISACTTKDQNGADSNNDDNYEITLSSQHFLETFTVEQIKQLPSSEVSMTSISSSGDVNEVTVVGITLNQLLEDFNMQQQQFDEATITAKDSYSMVVPANIVKSKDIYIVWEIDGEPLHQPHAPLRVAIADERSMYWVGQLDTIELAGLSLVDDEDITEISRLLFVDNVYSFIESEEVEYYGSNDQAIYVTDLLSYFNIELDEMDISFEATDDFKKDEKAHVFKQGMIKYTNEHAPLFFALDMPKGMHVKNMMLISVMNNELYFLNSLFEKYSEELIEINERESLALSVVFELSTIKEHDSYVFVASDGYEVTLDAQKIAVAYLYEEDNEYHLQVESDQKSDNVKNIVEIKAP